MVHSWRGSLWCYHWNDGPAPEDCDGKEGEAGALVGKGPAPRFSAGGQPLSKTVWALCRTPGNGNAWWAYRVSPDSWLVDREGGGTLGADHTSTTAQELTCTSHRPHPQARQSCSHPEVLVWSPHPPDPILSGFKFLKRHPPSPSIPTRYRHPAWGGMATVCLLPKLKVTFKSSSVFPKTEYARTKGLEKRWQMPGEPRKV